MYTHKNCQFGKREFSGIFPLAGGEFCHFKTGIPGGPGFVVAEESTGLGLTEILLTKLAALKLSIANAQIPLV